MAALTVCRRLPAEKVCSTSVATAKLTQLMRQLPVLLLLLLLPLGDQGVHSTMAGTCYSSMQPGNRCTGLVWADVTHEQCCQLWTDRAIFWSEKSYGVFLYHHLTRSGVPACRPCHVSCDTLKCKAPRHCELGPTGLPSCVCPKHCAESELANAAAADEYNADAVSALVAGEPVCGDDGKTYDSYCSLLYENCHTGSHVRVAYLGACRAHSCSNVTCAKSGQRCIVDQHNMPHCVQCFRPCRTYGSEPCCGSDGRTYASVCHLVQHNCLHGLSVVTQYFGECRAHTVCNEETNCLPRLSADRRCVRLLPLDAAVELTTTAPDTTVDGNDNLNAVADHIAKDSPSDYNDYDGSYSHAKYVCINCEQAKACALFDGEMDGDEEVEDDGNDGDSRDRSDPTSDENIGAAAKPRLRVCASNNVTYGSWCRMTAAACRLRVYLRVLHPGRCSANQSEIEATVQQYQRVIRRHHTREIGGSGFGSRQAPLAKQPAAPRRRGDAATAAGRRRHTVI